MSDEKGLSFLPLLDQKFVEDFESAQWRMYGHQVIARLVNENNLEVKEKIAIAVALGLSKDRATAEFTC